jgi:DNA-nicking Smr family endonuclease
MAKGIKHNKYQKLIDAELDLHGLYLVSAQELLAEFLVRCKDNNYRRVRLITGKGLHSSSGQPVIREMAIDLLRAADMRFSFGKQNEGGEGVIVVDL